MSISIETVVIIIVLLITVVGVIYFFREELQVGSDMTDVISDDVDRSAVDIDLNPEKIFCSPDKGDYYECTGGSSNGATYATGNFADPYLACLSGCEKIKSPGKCSCVKE